MEILLVSAEPGRYAQALAPFARRGASLASAPTLQEGLSAIKASLPSPPALVILDEGEGRGGDQALRQAAMQIIKASAFTYVCAISSRPAEALHDAMEGLGMLPPLPANPTEADGEHLLQQLSRFIPV